MGDTVYEGRRYKRFTRDDSTTSFDYYEVWTGLYDQAYSKYGYVFPSEFKWNEIESGGGTTQTLLTGFTTLKNNNNTQTNTDYHLYCYGDANLGTLVHLRQKLDGTYAESPESCDVAHVSVGTVKFKFSDKFDGFHVIGYSYGTISSNGSGINTVDMSAGEVTENINTSQSQKVYVYHKRVDDLELQFNDNYIHSNAGYELKNIKFEQPLSAYEDAYIPAARPHYAFDGWYEDVTCTQPFNFNITMPNANKMIYARWVPERYRITIDPDGGELPLGSTFSTYFNVNYNELVDEYSAVRRDYVESDSGDYVYFDFSYEKLLALSATPEGSSILDKDGNLDFPGALRKAFYIHESEVRSFFDNGANVTLGGRTFSYKDYMDYQQFERFYDWGKRYSKVIGDAAEYQLYAWYRVNDDGTTDPMPYDFRSNVVEDITLKAKWTRVGKYAIVYNPTMNGTGITGDMARYNDPMESDRKYVDGAAAIVLQEPTNLRVDQTSDNPNIPDVSDIDPEEYIFRGWRVVNGETRAPLEDNVFYNAGDTIYIDARWTDLEDHVIHMEAYYEKRDSSVRKVDYATLVLYANPGDNNRGGVVNRADLANDKYEYADLTDNSLHLDRQLNNFAVDLSQYSKNFTNTNGYKLIGWNKDSYHSPDDYIPDFAADAVIGADKEIPLPNKLYAVWEPMVYLTLHNDTLY